MRPLAEWLTRWPFGAEPSLIRAVKAAPSDILRPIVAEFADGTTEIVRLADVPTMRPVRTQFSLPLEKQGLHWTAVEKMVEEEW